MNKLINYEDKIFVAGHNGMVGKAVCRSLRKYGYHNIITRDRTDLDLANSKAVDEFLYQKKPNIVVLAAAKVGGIYANNKYPGEFILENLMIQTNVIKSSWNSNVKRLLFLGSSCIYPKFCKQPIKEQYLLNGNLEKTNEYYAIAKIAGLKLCEGLNIQYGFDAISLMPTNLYGTGDNYDLETSHVLPALVRKFCDAKENNLDKVICWGDGSPLREFLHCDDLGDACVFTLENLNFDRINQILDLDEYKISHINIGTGSDLTIKNLAELIANEVGFEGEIVWDLTKPNGTPQKKLDVSLINKLGWGNRISLEDGLRSTIKEYMETIS